MKDVLKSIEGTSEYIDLVRQYELKSENNNLLALALAKPDVALGRDAAGLLVKFNGLPLVQPIITGNDTAKTSAILKSLGKVGSKESIDFIQAIVYSKSYNQWTRSKAAEMLGKSQSGEDRVLELLSQKKVPEPLMQPMVTGVKGAWRKTIYIQALSYLPGAEAALADTKAPTLQEITALHANASNGKEVFVRSCNVCHQVNGEGYDVGPKLSDIGSKLPLEGLYDAIIHPSSGISFGYENWQLDMKDGSTLTGIISSKTETDIDLKYPGGSVQKIKTSDVKKTTELKESMMPSTLFQAMSKQELSDLIGYLASLKKK